MTVSDFIGLTLQEIKDLLLAIEHDPSLSPFDLGSQAVTAGATSAVTSMVTVNMGGVTIIGEGEPADARRLTDEIEREMAERRLRGF